MYIHNETGCVNVSIQEGEFCVASRKGLEITFTPPIALITDYFELCGYVCTVEETSRNTVLLLKDEKQYGGDFTSCLEREWKRDNVSVSKSIQVTLFCESDLDSEKANGLLCSMISSLRKTHPLIFCPVQRSILSDLEVQCKNIAESCQLLGIKTSAGHIWTGVLARQHQLLLQLSHNAWLGRLVQGVQISTVFRFLENAADLTQDESFEMTDYDVYEGMEKVAEEVTQASEHLSLLTISNTSATDILSDATNESMTLLEEWDSLEKSFESSDSLLVEQTFDTFAEILSDDDCI
ncbi:hypothetical protein CJU89_4145 [Yarrowia sp. B02]|nr:hypothetical protein CJU89_4145 [Yarrowia sp. B02]